MVGREYVYAGGGKEKESIYGMLGLWKYRRVMYVESNICRCWEVVAGDILRIVGVLCALYFCDMVNR